MKRRRTVIDLYVLDSTEPYAAEAILSLARPRPHPNPASLSRVSSNEALSQCFWSIQPSHLHIFTPEECWLVFLRVGLAQRLESVSFSPRRIGQSATAAIDLAVGAYCGYPKDC